MRTLFARIFLAACSAVLPASGTTLAQTPSKGPVRVLVGSAPTGPGDVQIRLLVPTMGEVLGQVLIVDNRVSPDGGLAATIAAKAPPDGRTLLVGNSGTHAVNATLHTRLGYDSIRDFAPISQFSTAGFIVAGHPRLPGKSILDLAAYAKPFPGRLNVAVPGAIGELAGDALWARLGIKATNVHHKDSTPATMALVSGDADLCMLSPLAARPHVHAGRLKAYGITSTERSWLMPEVPTLMEQGIGGYEFAFWNGLFAPANTAKEIIDAVYRSVVQALKSPDVRNRFDELGVTPVGSSPQEFAAVVKRDVEKFRKLIIDTGMPRL